MIRVMDEIPVLGKASLPIKKNSIVSKNLKNHSKLNKCYGHVPILIKIWREDFNGR